MTQKKIEIEVDPQDINEVRRKLLTALQEITNPDDHDPAVFFNNVSVDLIALAHVWIMLYRSTLAAQDAVFPLPFRKVDSFLYELFGEGLPPNMHDIDKLTEAFIDFKKKEQQEIKDAML